MRRVRDGQLQLKMFQMRNTKNSFLYIILEFELHKFIFLGLYYSERDLTPSLDRHHDLG